MMRRIYFRAVSLINALKKWGFFPCDYEVNEMNDQQLQNFKFRNTDLFFSVTVSWLTSFLKTSSSRQNQPLRHDTTSNFFLVQRLW